MTDPWCWYIYANMAPINILPLCYYIYQHHGSYGIPANWRVCYGKRMKIWSCKNGSWIYLLKMIHFPRRPSGQMASTMRRGSHCKRTRVTRQSPGIFCGSTFFEAMLGPRFLLIFSMNMSSALILGYLGLTELPISWEFTSGKRGWSFVMTACDGMISSTKIKGSTKQIIRKASENKELIQRATQLEISTGQAGCWFLRAVEDIESCWDVKHPASRVCAIIMTCLTYLHYPTLSSWKRRSTANFIFWFWRPTERERIADLLIRSRCVLVCSNPRIQVSCSLISVV